MVCEHTEIKKIRCLAKRGNNTKFYWFQYHESIWRLYNIFFSESRQNLWKKLKTSRLPSQWFFVCIVACFKINPFAANHPKKHKIQRFLSATDENPFAGVHRWSVNVYFWWIPVFRGNKIKIDQRICVFVLLHPTHIQRQRFTKFWRIFENRGFFCRHFKQGLFSPTH